MKLSISLLAATLFVSGTAIAAFDSSIKKLECRTKTVNGDIETFYKFSGTVITDDLGDFDKFLSDPSIDLTEVNQSTLTVTEIGSLQLQKSGSGASYIAFEPASDSWEGDFFGINFYPSASNSGTIIAFDGVGSGPATCELLNYKTPNT